MNIQYDKSKIESTLKETSIDDSDLSNVVYLVEDPHTAENFDEISKQIAAKVRMGHKPRSCDALYRSGKYYNLIEFKNRNPRICVKETRWSNYMKKLSTAWDNWQYI